MTSHRCHHGRQATTPRQPPHPLTSLSRPFHVTMAAHPGGRWCFRTHSARQNGLPRPEAESRAQGRPLIYPCSERSLSAAAWLVGMGDAGHEEAVEDGSDDGPHSSAALRLRPALGWLAERCSGAPPPCRLTQAAASVLRMSTTTADAAPAAADDDGMESAGAGSWRRPVQVRRRIRLRRPSAQSCGNAAGAWALAADGDGDET